MPAPDGPLKRPQTLGGVVYLGVVAASVVGLAIVFFGAWRTGLAWMGTALLVSAGTRLVLSERRAGMLRVRRKWSDVLMLTVAGVGLIVLTIVIPNQSPT
jgi:multisubunit Na+/H+ antiporter MnhB subunit